MLTALVFLAILTGSVLVHELAHYLAARSVGVPVRAFSVGMGPVLARRSWRGTEWRVSLLPLGGYVDLPGMAAKEDESGVLVHPDEGIATKPLWAKLWVLSGGVLANFALGVLLVAAVILLEPGFRQLVAGVDVPESGAEIVSVDPGSPAEALGLEPGDVIVAINGARDPNRAQVVEAIQRGDGLSLTVRRGGAEVALSAPWPPEGSETPVLGVRLAPLEVEDVAVGPLQATGEAAAFGVRLLPDMVRGFARGFGAALSGQPSEEVAGPVGIVSAVGEARRFGLPAVLFLAALINFSLAVFNLLPIPGLDGGRMLLATLVAARGRPFRPGQEEALHFLGVMAVLALMVLITFQELGGLLRS